VNDHKLAKQKLRARWLSVRVCPETGLAAA
jgi:hypothetical protein